MSAMLNVTQNKVVVSKNKRRLKTRLSEPFYLVLKMNGRGLSDRQLADLDKANEDLRFETNAKGDLIIMPPPFPETSRRNFKIDLRIGIWAETDQKGVCFESSAKFTLPNGAKRMPDVAWILKERYFALSEEEREEKFTQIAPDFVVELRSKSDRLNILQKKMSEYIENGVRLGWLIDPYEKKVHIYRANGEIEILDNPETVDGEDVLEGFSLDLSEIL